MIIAATPSSTWSTRDGFVERTSSGGGVSLDAPTLQAGIGEARW
ncbi:hypothetical protein SAMN05444920_102170 [Nonomuraea solani]|uniref:Uncharacterized protein n=1 Tax=Nonomuraea solani TaxID=1144553 RepID=A0A1H5Y8K6_9ACTN|nr:hypothetical protein [Nonomuraea solani]SEG19987.1 hypothetical protein SAMN05444920_102170 [Nonomuraea solani]